MDWDKIGYDVIPTDQMYIMKSSPEGTFSEGTLIPFGPVEINPNSSVLNYGQVIITPFLTWNNTFLIFK